MIDIFKDTDPSVYCADVEVLVIIPVRGNKRETRTIRVKAEPITLLNGEIASKKIENRFFKRIYSKYINRSEFEKIIFKIKKISNKKFLSELCYRFNKTIH